MEDRISQHGQETLKNLGETLRRLRKARGLSIDELCAGCGLSPTYTGSVELGRRDVSFSTLRTFAHAFGVPVRDVIGPPPGISPNAAEVVRMFEASTEAMRAASMVLLREHPSVRETAQAQARHDDRGGVQRGRGGVFGGLRNEAKTWEEEPKTSEELGARIRRLRWEHDLTIDEFAARAGLSHNYVATVERGKRDPCLLAMCAMAKAFEMSARELLGGQLENILPESIEFGRLYDVAPERMQQAIAVMLREHLGKGPHEVV